MGPVLPLPPNSSDRGHSWGGGSPGQPLLPWLPTPPPELSWKAEERKGPPHSHRVTQPRFLMGPFLSPPFVLPQSRSLMPLQGLQVPHPPPVPSPYKQRRAHHLSLLCPEARPVSPEESRFHNLSTGAAAGGSRKARTGWPSAWMPWPPPSFQPGAGGLLWAGAGGAAGPAAGRSCSLPGSL